MKGNNLRILLILLTVLGLASLISACSSTPMAPAITAIAPAPTVIGTDGVTGTFAGVRPQDLTLGDIEAAVAQRTHVPTGLPDSIEQVIYQAMHDSGLAKKRFPGLAVEHWINIGVSILFMLIGYILVIWLLFGLIDRAVYFFR